MLRCIAIDDEPKALDVLNEYIEKAPFLELAGLYRDALQALDFLQKNQVDLIFLDINMPDITGIQFLNSLTNKPMVIFSTAYSEYALDSYDYDAVDYLLKPIEFDRFLKAANKAYDQFNLRNRDLTSTSADEGKEFILVKSGSDIHNIKIEDILFVESAGNYVEFNLPKDKIMALMNMKEVLDILPGSRFSRIHKSYIVAIKHLTLIERHQARIGKKEIPIGNVYRESFFKMIGK